MRFGVHVLGLAGVFLSAVVLVVGGATPAPAQTSSCADPQAACGATISPACLQRVGAGALPALESGDACAAQFTAYRTCLADIVASCDAPQSSGGLLLGADPNLEADAQRELQRLGYYQGALDGDWGPASRAAMRAFQKREELHVDGGVYPEMLVALRLRRPPAENDIAFAKALAEKSAGIWELVFTRSGYQCVDFLELNRSGSVLIMKGAIDRKSWMPLRIAERDLGLFLATSPDAFSFEPLGFSVVDGKLTMLDEAHDFGMNDQCVYERVQVYPQ